MSIPYRIFGQALTLAVHGVNGLVMLYSMFDKQLIKDDKIKTMISMQSCYLTVWNIIFQITYFFLAFTCDVLTVMGKESMIPKRLRKIREVFFATTLWPTTFVVFVFFWPVFLTNRELLFPAFVDKIFSFKSNLVMHFFILPAAVWEMVFYCRPVPKKHDWNVALTTAINVAYVYWILRTYNKTGLWPYPLLSLVYGTVYFPMLVGFIYFLSMCGYFAQWKITALVWGSKMEESNKVK